MTILVGSPIRIGVNVARAIQLDDTVDTEPVVSGNTGAKNPVQIPGTIIIHDGADMYYEHVQSSPASTWTISHNLGVRPNIQVLDSADEIILAEVDHTNVNVAVVLFPSPQTGKAVCS